MALKSQKTYEVDGKLSALFQNKTRESGALFSLRVNSWKAPWERAASHSS